MHRQRKTQAWTVFILLLIMFLSVSATGMAQEGTWARKADMKIPRGGLSTAVVDGKIYAIGGVTRVGGLPQTLSTVEAYDPATNKWTERAAMPTKRYSLSTAVVNGKIYAIGGSGGGGDVLSTVEVYDPKRNTWTRHHKAAMPNARWGLATAVVNGKIYAIGGITGLQVLSTVEVYDPATNKWTKRSAMPTKRFSLATAVVNGKIYAIGGSGGGPDVLSTVEVYDPKRNTWTRHHKAAMPNARWGLATAVVDGKIYAIGGLAGAAGFLGGQALGMVEAYDPGALNVNVAGKLATLWGKLKVQD
jgi:N-acetylneuraminic acid mutarotase